MQIKVVTHFGECVYGTSTVLRNKLKEKQEEVSELLIKPFEKPKVHIVIEQTTEDLI